MASSSVSIGDIALTFTSSIDSSQQPYRIYVPTIAKSGSPLPLAVVLHGKGVDQNAWMDLTPIKEYGEKYGYVIAAPYSRGDYWYRGPAEDDVLDIIREMQKHYSIDTNRIYLMGHSMGGWGTWRVALHHPDVFAAISPMSGFTPVELLPNAHNLSPLIFHDTDDPIVTVEESRAAAEELSKLGITHDYQELQGYGHGSKLIGDSLDKVFTWFNGHPRINKPQHFDYVTRSAKWGKIYFIQVLKTIDYPKIASIKAKLEKSNHWVIKTDNISELAIDLSAIYNHSEDTIQMTVDKSTLSLSKQNAWIVLSKSTTPLTWETKVVTQKPIVEPSPNLLEVTDNYLKDKSKGRDTQTIEKLLRKKFDVEISLFNQDMFAITDKKVTSDMLLDTYLYSNERLAIFTCKGEILMKPITLVSEPVKVYPKDVKIDPEKTYRVIAPIRIVNTLGIDADIMPETIGEYLIEIYTSKK